MYFREEAAEAAIPLTRIVGNSTAGNYLENAESSTGYHCQLHVPNLPDLQGLNDSMDTTASCSSAQIQYNSLSESDGPDITGEKKNPNVLLN
jgi:hypothetical protein